MQIYAGLSVVAAVIGLAILSALKPAKTNPDLMLTLDEVVDDPVKSKGK